MSHPPTGWHKLLIPNVRSHFYLWKVAGFSILIQKVCGSKTSTSVMFSIWIQQRRRDTGECLYANTWVWLTHTHTHSHLGEHDCRCLKNPPETTLNSAAHSPSLSLSLTHTPSHSFSPSSRFSIKPSSLWAHTRSVTCARALAERLVLPTVEDEDENAVNESRRNSKKLHIF